MSVLQIKAQKDAAAFHSKWLEIEEQERQDYSTVTVLMDETRASALDCRKRILIFQSEPTFTAHLLCQ